MYYLYLRILSSKIVNCTVDGGNLHAENNSEDGQKDMYISSVCSKASQCFCVSLNIMSDSNTKMNINIYRKDFALSQIESLV